MPIDSGLYAPASTYDEALRRATRAWGVLDEYWDIFGIRHVTEPDVQRTILRSLGFCPDSVEQLNEAVRRRAELEIAPLAPVTLVLALSGGVVPVSLPDGSSELFADFAWEGGGHHSAWFGVAEMRKIGHRYEIPLPADAPLGYHRLLLRSGDLRSETRLILCPDRAHRPDFLNRGLKGAGVAVSVYGLRSDRNWGCGDFTDLKAFCDWARQDAGAAFVALNPLHSIPNRQPYNTSPYLPNCSFYRNPLYLDVEAIREVKDSALAQKFLSSDVVRSRLAALRRSKYVEYEKVYALKVRFLKLGFREFRKSPPPVEFTQYVDGEGALLDKYALYCALDEVLHKRDRNVWIWPDWPEEYKDPESPAVARFASEYPRLILFYKWVQWNVDRQLAAAQEHARAEGLPIGLYHDLALATDRCGSDLWAHRKFYVAGCRVGAPPDDFSPKGQDWAFPPPSSMAHNLDGYRLFSESIRKNCRHGGALRIDHVMRFFRLFWIPEGKDATQGAYVQDFWEDLVQILALESVRNQVVVIGEDLGTVEPYIRESLHKYGVLSYRLLYFEKSGRDFKTPDQYPREALVSVSTHDLPTLEGFWMNRDIEARRRAGVLPDEASYREQLRSRTEEKQRMLDVFHRLRLVPADYARRAVDIPEFTGELHYAAVGFLASTPSELMVLNQEDLFKDPDQQNLPGTTEQYPNWRHKMRYKIEELRTDRQAVDCTRMFRHWLEKTSRIV